MTTNRCTLLIAAAEPYTLQSLSTALAKEFEIMTARSAEAARGIVAERDIDLVVADQKLPDAGGMQLLEWIKQRSPQTVTLLLAEYSSLEAAMNAISRGYVYSYLLKPYRTDELLRIVHNAAERFTLERSRNELLEQLERLHAEMERQVQERTRELAEANHLLKQRLRELETLALTDPLTGLLNRRAIDEVLKAELRRHARYPSALAVGMIDADNFREINKQHLLPGGDQALIHLSRILTGSLRTVDTVGRIGGEEFLVVAPETGLEGAAVLAERIRAYVEARPAFYNDASIPMTVSVGFSVAEEGVPAEFEQIKHAAAAALSEAKDRGRNCAVVQAMQV